MSNLESQCVSLFQHRVVLVTGKGGVGKSTLTAGLGLLAAQRGLRTLLVELQGCQSLPGYFGARSEGYRITPLQPGLEALSVTSEEAMEDYLLQQLPVKTLYRVIFKSRWVAPLMRGLPGIHDLIQLGKVWELAQMKEGRRDRWDLILVDAPATGHGLTLLDAPRAMAELTTRGPLYDNAQMLAELFESPEQTALVLTALPTELSVRETSECLSALESRRDQIQLAVLNRHDPPPPGLALWPQLSGLTRGRGAEHARSLFQSELRALARRQRWERSLQTALRGIPLASLPEQHGGPQTLSALEQLMRSMRLT